MESKESFYSKKVSGSEKIDKNREETKEFVLKKDGSNLLIKEWLS